MVKQKFKNGVAKVPGSDDKWDLTYQVDGSRQWERVIASSRDEAAAIRHARMTEFRSRQRGTGEPVHYLDDVFEQLKQDMANAEARGERAHKSTLGIIERFQRFFYDYPRHMGKVWKTTADFTPDDFIKYRDYYGITLNRPRGLSSEMRTIKTIFFKMCAMGVLSELRLLELRKFKTPKKNFVPLVNNPETDFEKVLSWLKQNYPHSYRFYCFLAMTMHRPGEVRKLLRANVNLDESYIFVPGEITKNREPSMIPINDHEARKVIMDAIDFSRKLDSPFLFLNELGRPLSANNPLRIFKEAARACGIPNWQQFTVYQLKKRGITKARSRNISAEVISGVSGHKDLNSVLKHYSFPDPQLSGQVFDAVRINVK